jgi:hypothetical protein
MADPLNREQQDFFEELVSFDIPDSIAVIIALKTNWGEIRRWDENKAFGNNNLANRNNCNNGRFNEDG